MPLKKVSSKSGAVHRYHVEYLNHYCPKEATFFKSGFSPEIYENPKLFLNQTGDYLKCCYDDAGYYCLNNMHVGYPVNAEHSLLYISAILCSRLMDFYYKAQSLEEGRANAQTDIDVLDILPIRAITFVTPLLDRARLQEDGKSLYGLGESAGESLLDFVDAQLAATPQRADGVHDLLAFLAEEMTDMNKQRQVELRGFLTWLERAIGVKVVGLAGKSTVMAYDEHDIGTLLDILRRNRKRLKVSPDSRSFQEELERELNASMARLSPLTSRIAATDRLIDQIVYKLYGLTEDEVAIVEGRRAEGASDQ